MSKTKKIIIIVIAVVFAVFWLLYLFAGQKPAEIEYGASFSPYQAQSLGLDWKQVYTAMLDDLNIRKVRISAYWNKIEPRAGEFDFSDLDYQVQEAEKRGAKIILAVGRRLPHWPECHDPEWLKTLSDDYALKNALLSYTETVVLRYQNNPAIEMWQVENEPFLSSFGECPKPDVDLLDKEIAVVKKFDPVRPVLITDSGELSLWLKAGKRGDVFGSTLYRYVFSDIFNRYWINYNPYWLYRVKGGLLRLLYGKKEFVIIELQGEPWTTKGILNTPIEEQFKTMSMQKFEKLLSVARAVGFSKQYWWGVEWWYWMKQQGHPEFWDKAKEVMNKN